MRLPRFVAGIVFLHIAFQSPSVLAQETDSSKEAIFTPFWSNEANEKNAILIEITELHEQAQSSYSNATSLDRERKLKSEIDNNAYHKLSGYYSRVTCAKICEAVIVIPPTAKSNTNNSPYNDVIENLSNINGAVKDRYVVATSKRETIGTGVAVFFNR